MQINYSRIKWSTFFWVCISETPCQVASGLTDQRVCTLNGKVSDGKVSVLLIQTSNRQANCYQSSLKPASVARCRSPSSACKYWLVVEIDSCPRLFRTYRRSTWPSIMREPVVIRSQWAAAWG